MRSREIPPLKAADIEVDSNRYSNNHYETPLNRKYLLFNLPFSLLKSHSVVFFVSGRIFFYSPHYPSGQQRQQLNKRLNLSTKRQTSIGSVEI